MNRVDVRRRPDVLDRGATKPGVLDDALDQIVGATRPIVLDDRVERLQPLLSLDGVDVHSRISPYRAGAVPLRRRAV
jgi:hypothetical protein